MFEPHNIDTTHQIWNHPDILYQVVEQRKDDNDLDLDEAKGDSQSSSRKNRKGASSRAIGRTFSFLCNIFSTLPFQ